MYNNFMKIIGRMNYNNKKYIDVKKYLYIYTFYINNTIIM